MGMPRLGRPGKKADWDGIKRDYLAGISLSDLAKKWRVSEGTISSRASRNEWPSVSRIQQTVGKVARMTSEVAEAGIQRAHLEQDSPERLALDGLQSLASMQKGMDPLEYQMVVAEFATRAMHAGLQSVKKPANWRELSVADSIARRALGLDSKGGSSATAMVRITGPNGSVDVAAGATVDVDTSVDEEMDDWGD